MTARRGRLALAAASAGTAFEWYDFFLYGTASALVFPAVFFPTHDPLAGVLLSFAAFATGFIARPLGGLLAGSLGDRWGRRPVLTVTLLMMGVATVGIGLLPGYAAIGALAPTLLVALRFVQGMAAGGEWPGAVLMALEHASDRRGLRGGIVGGSLYGGLLLGNLAFVLVVATTDEAALLAWGWRVPFLASALLVVIGLVLRHRVDETPEFPEGHLREPRPLRTAIADRRNVTAVILVRTGQNVAFYTVTVFCLSYAVTVLRLPKDTTLTALLIAATLAAVLCPVWGVIGEQIGMGRLTALSLVGLGLLAAPLFLMLDAGHAGAITAVVAVMIGVVGAAADGVQPLWFASLFPPGHRYSGMSVGREVAGVVGGGLAPLAATALVAAVGHWWPVAVMMIVASALGVAGAVIARPVALPGALAAGSGVLVAGAAGGVVPDPRAAGVGIGGSAA